MVEFLAYTGLRASENAGLEVGDVEFTERTTSPHALVHVRRTRERRSTDNVRVWVTSTPK